MSIPQALSVLLPTAGSGSMGSLAIGALCRRVRNGLTSLFSAAIRVVAINRDSPLLRSPMA